MAWTGFVGLVAAGFSLAAVRPRTLSTWDDPPPTMMPIRRADRAAHAGWARRVARILWLRSP